MAVSINTGHSRQPETFIHLFFFRFIFIFHLWASIYEHTATSPEYDVMYEKIFIFHSVDHWWILLITLATTRQSLFSPTDYITMLTTSIIVFRGPGNFQEKSCIFFLFFSTSHFHDVFEHNVEILSIILFLDETPLGASVI